MANSNESSLADIKAINQFKKSISDNKPWYIALLEAVRLWKSTGEYYNGRYLQYLIDNEAFDWLLLAERLCEEVKGLIPEEELINLLFFDKPPIELSKDNFQEMIGRDKYQAYLNYLYGILIEEMLVLAVMGEVRKRKRSLGLIRDGEVRDEAFLQIYGATQNELLSRFQKEKGYTRHLSIDIRELQEFTYWLFKQRLKRSDKSCVASDTNKALLQLYRYMKLKSQITFPLI
jgi:hypothetical protein